MSTMPLLRTLLLAVVTMSGLGTAMAAAPSVPPPRPRILGVSHAAFFVSDMPKARAFYEEFLGFGSPFSIPRKNPNEQLVWIKINDRQSVELFPGSEVARGAAGAPCVALGVGSGGARFVRATTRSTSPRTATATRPARAAKSQRGARSRRWSRVGAFA